METPKNLLSRKPMITGQHPDEYFERHDILLLRDHVVNWRRMEKGEKYQGDLKDPTVTYLLGVARSMGYYPSYVDMDGRLIWGVALQSDLQREMEKNADLYLKKGQECKKDFKRFFNRMEG